LLDRAHARLNIPDASKNRRAQFVEKRHISAHVRLRSTAL
jgi:hypothetical protein